MKCIRCYHCQSVCETGSGYYHDERLNIRCKRCHEIIFATNEDDEKELQKLFSRPTRDHHEARHNHHTASSHQAHGPYGYSHRHGNHLFPGHGGGQQPGVADDRDQDYD